MIENYNEVMNQWANPSVGTCTNMMEISPEMDLKRWAVQQTVTILANADYYYTKREVDKLLADITSSAVTREQVEAMIRFAIASKADKSELQALADNVYTKGEVNIKFDNYSLIDDHILYLNNH